MSVEQLPSGRWRVKWKTSDGRHPGKTFDTENEARAYDARLKADRKMRRAQRRKQAAYTGHTISEAVYGHFERKVTAEKWSAKTREANEAAWKHIVDDIGADRVDLFTVDDAEDYQTRLLKKLRVRSAERQGLITNEASEALQEKIRHGEVGKWKLTPGERDLMDEARSLGLGIPMAMKTMGLLFGGMKYALRRGWVEVNVVGLIDKITPKDYQVRVAVPPIVAEAVRRRFLALGDVESATLVSVMNTGGFRPQEALGLNRHASVDERTIKVFQAVTDGKLGPTKTRRNRTVTKVPQLGDDLAGWFDLTPGWTLAFEAGGAHGRPHATETGEHGRTTRWWRAFSGSGSRRTTLDDTPLSPSTSQRADHSVTSRRKLGIL